MSRSARRSPSRRVHSSLKVVPARVRDHDVRLRNRGRVLAQHVKQDDQVAGAPIENSIELRAVVAAQLTQLAAYLARVREWRRRCRGWLIVQSIDLQVDRRLLALVEPRDEVVDWLRPIRCAIVDGLRARHAAFLPMCSVRSHPSSRATRALALAPRGTRSPQSARLDFETAKIWLCQAKSRGCAPVCAPARRKRHLRVWAGALIRPTEQQVIRSYRYL